MASGSNCQLSDLDPASLTNILAHLDVRSLLSIQALFNRHLAAASRSPSVWLEQLWRDWLVRLQASTPHLPELAPVVPLPFLTPIGSAVKALAPTASKLSNLECTLLVLLQEAASSLCRHPMMTLFGPPNFALILMRLASESCSRHSKGSRAPTSCTVYQGLFNHTCSTASALSGTGPANPPAAHLPPARPAAAAAVLTQALSCAAGGARSAPQPAAHIQSCSNGAAPVAALQSRLDKWRSRRGPATLQDGQHADPHALGKPLHSAGAECGCHRVSAGELGGFRPHMVPPSLGLGPAVGSVWTMMQWVSHCRAMRLVRDDFGFLLATGIALQGQPLQFTWASVGFCLLLFLLTSLASHDRRYVTACRKLSSTWLQHEGVICLLSPPSPLMCDHLLRQVTEVHVATPDCHLGRAPAARILQVATGTCGRSLAMPAQQRIPDGLHPSCICRGQAPMRTRSTWSTRNRGDT